MASFLILTPLGKTAEFGNVITFDWLGSKGMFIAMLIGVVTVIIFRFFIQKNILVNVQCKVPHLK